MKKIFTIALLFTAIISRAQLLSWTPDFIQETSTGVIVTVNAAYGNQGLYGHTSTDVYVHTGVITNYSTTTSDWKHVRGVWATTYSYLQATYLGNNVWQYKLDTTLAGGLRALYGVTDPNEHIQKIAILFRSGDGNIVQRNIDGSDMYIPVYDNGLHARIDNPFRQPTYVPAAQPLLKSVGDNLPIVAKASLAGSTIQVYFNGTLISTVTGTKDSINATIADSGYQTIIAKATNGASTSSDTLKFYVDRANNVAAIPAGKVEGVNYEAGDTSVTLVLYAPFKKNIKVVGDFNNWTASAKYQMNITADGNYFWIRLIGLTKGTQYAYQYYIDNSLQLADYNAQLVLDKSADPFIPAGNFPNLKPFPAQAAGTLAGIFQTGQTPYAWQDAGFVKPDKKNLAVYELLVRDFVATQSWNTLADTLNYLKKLGINTIEVMPFNNFEGASSWGYNSNFFFAPDKVYGTPAALKHFVDACHQKGIAVIMDLAQQDVFGSSPLVQMYSIGGIPSPTNPWLDQYATHAFNVGFEFNHSSTATINLRNRIYAYWIDSFHLDGFRFDLAGGYTQTNTCDAYGNNCNVSAWEGNFDQVRQNTWDNIYASLESIKPNTYCILESFVNYTEQKHYTDAGMMTWGNGGNENYSFNQATMGYNTGWDFSGGIYTSSGLTQPGLVTYQESHDEERLQFKNEAYGNASGSYNVKDTATGLARDGMAAAFWAMMPGPKMMYEFEELGYDYSINYCTDGTIQDGCRTSPKPIRWDYLNNANRLALHDIYTKLLNLKTNPAYFATFSTGSVNKNLSGSVKWMSVYSSALQVMVLGNFDVTSQTSTVSFPSTGIWYNFFTGKDTTITSTALTNVTLAAGQYAVYINQSSALPVSWLSFTGKASGNNSVLNWSITTASEANGNYYSVERSNDGVHFTAVGKVNVAKVSASVNSYTYTDASPLKGINYYRLAEVDRDGKQSYSSIVKVMFASNADLWQVYPNPVIAGTNAALHLKASFGKLNLQLTNASGKVVYSYSTANAAAGTAVNIPSANFAKGIYILQIITEKASGTEKIIVN